MGCDVLNDLFKGVSLYSVPPPGGGSTSAHIYIHRLHLTVILLAVRRSYTYMECCGLPHIGLSPTPPPSF
jgi:hypothetical protein